jgi:uncharacterized SAM-binding protein YcdF (DUF218 family)
MFLFKKILAPFFFPLPLILGLLIAGLILLWFTKRQKLGKILAACGTAILMLLSFNSISKGLLKSLERRYPPLNCSESSHGHAGPIRGIVVLGGGHVSDEKLPITSQIGASSMSRLVEGIRQQRLHPGSKLILSGGGWWGDQPDGAQIQGHRGAGRTHQTHGGK